MQQQPAAAATSFEVGWMFVHEYYTFINKEPAKLHCFYTKKSTLTHGVEGEDTKPYLGQHDIHDKILSLDFQDCKVLVSNVDSQASANGGIIIQVLGEMSNRGGPSRKFSQTFFLAEQPNGYFVLNDIFRYLKEDDGDEDDSELNKSTLIDPFTDTTTTTANTSTSNGWGNVNAFHDMNGHAHEEQVQDIPQAVQQQVQQHAQPVQPVQPTDPEPVQAAPEPEPYRQPEPVARPSTTKPASSPAQQAAPAPAGPKTWANLVAANKRPQAQAPVTSPLRAQAPAIPISPVPASASPRKRDESVTVFVKGLPDVSSTAVQNAAGAIAPVKTFEFATNKQHGFLEMENADAYKAILAQGTIQVENATVQVEERRRPQNATTQKQRQSFDGKNKEQQQQQQRGERAERGALNTGARGRGRGGKREK